MPTAVTTSTAENLANPSALPVKGSAGHLPIPGVEGSRRVLLLLDSQVCNLSDPPTGVPSAKTLRDSIHQVLTQAREAVSPPMIIHVRNIGDAGEPDEYGAKGWELMFSPREGEYVVDKRKNNAFAGTRLGDWIRNDAEIVVVGVMSDYSIRATCSAALGRSNEVLLIRGAHGTYDRVEVLYGGGVTPASTIETEIEEELEEAGVHLLDMKDLSGIFSDR